jgi:hypothetical protein
MPVRCPADLISLKYVACAGVFGTISTPTRVMPGTVCVRSSSHLALSPSPRFASPVTLPPG